MNVPFRAVEGRQALTELVSDLEEEIGRKVLLVAGLGRGVPETMPASFGSTDYRGTDITAKGTPAFDSRAGDSAALLAIALAGPTLRKDGVGGTGPYVEYGDGGEVVEDLMSSDPSALEGRTGTVLVVDSKGWESSDAQVAEKPELGDPLHYVWPHAGAIAVLATADISFTEIQHLVRQHPDPATAYPRPATNP